MTGTRAGRASSKPQADLLNPNLRGNLRDHAAMEQLLVMANLESLNAKLLEWSMDKTKRLEILNQTAREQMDLLSREVAARLGAGPGPTVLEIDHPLLKS